MSDTQPDTGAAEPDADAGATPDTGHTPIAEMSVEEQLDYFKSKARKAEDKLRDKPDPDVRQIRKERDGLKRELDALKQSTMTETEKAIDAAKAEGRLEALSEAGAKIARAEFKAATADRMDEDQLEGLLEGLDLKAFLDDRGDVDAAKIAAFVDRIAPKQEPGGFQAADLGQGSRTDAKAMALNGDPLLAAVKDKIGIRR